MAANPFLGLSIDEFDSIRYGNHFPLGKDTVGRSVRAAVVHIHCNPATINAAYHSHAIQPDCPHSHDDVLHILYPFPAYSRSPIPI